MKLSQEEREQFIQDNFNLVYHVVHKYFSRRSSGVLDFEDLTSIGTIGLIKAVDGFNEEYGVKFSTYATPMIWGEIAREFQDKRAPFHIPRAIRDLHCKINMENLQDDPIETIAEKLQKTPFEILQALQITNVCSLEAPIGSDEEGKTSVLETVPYTEDYNSCILLHDIKRIVKPQEYEIIKMRMDGGTQMDIGDLLGVSQAQVSRVLLKAKNKIKKYMLGEDDMKNCELAKKLLREGKTAAEVMEETGLSYATVNYHQKRLAEEGKKPWHRRAPKPGTKAEIPQIPAAAAQNVPPVVEVPTPTAVEVPTPTAVEVTPAVRIIPTDFSIMATASGLSTAAELAKRLSVVSEALFATGDVQVTYNINISVGSYAEGA